MSVTKSGCEGVATGVSFQALSKCSTMTHHRVAGLEDLTEQDGALSLGKRFSEWIEAAGVSDIWAVHTLKCACTHTIGI